MDNKKNPLVLVVDDEERMRRVIVDYLNIKGIETVEAKDGFDALEKFEKHSPALVILDVMMPRMDGWEVCRQISAKSAVPIIMLTAKGEEKDELKGFSIGADEYVKKPFSLRVLYARIESLLRRTGQLNEEKEEADTIITKVDGLVVNLPAREVFVDNQSVEITFTEFELLIYLLENPGIALSRDKILDNVWRYDYYGDTRTVDTHIKKLRAKLGKCGDFIKTVRGVGYKVDIKM